MFKNDETRALGKLTIEVKDKDGKLKQREEVKNLVVDTGLAYIECVPPHCHIHHGCEFGFVDDATIPGKLGRDVIHSENTVDIELTTQIIKLNGVVKEGFFCRVIVHDITTNRFRLNRYVTR